MAPGPGPAPGDPEEETATREEEADTAYAEAIRPAAAAPTTTGLPAGVAGMLSRSGAYPFLFTRMRDAGTTTPDFVACARRAMRLLAEDAMACLPVHSIEVLTPCGPCQGVRRSFDASHVTAVSIVRSGDCLVEAVREVEPAVRIGKILLQRDETSEDKKPVHYYTKLPPNIGGSGGGGGGGGHRYVLLCDPMLATGGSALAALGVLCRPPHSVPPSRVVFVNLISCPEGLRAVSEAYPEVKIVTAMVDPGLNEDKYIVPGLGDFGDRFYGTS